MGIEYLPGIKPGDLIDLSRFGSKDKKSFSDRDNELRLKKEALLKPESYFDYLKSNLAKIAEDTNQFFPGFLENDGRIALEGKDAAADSALTISQEDGFSRDFQGNQLGDLETWRQNIEKKEPSLTEMALTLMLHKFLKEDFIVARSSSYDDYNNGVDNVLIDKRTGEVLCGFDEVMSKKGEINNQRKELKLKKIMSRGGAKIKYGAKFENGRLVRSAVDHIPAFYISLDTNELGSLLAALSGANNQGRQIEESVFRRLINSLEAQIVNQELNSVLLEKTSLALKKLQTVADAFYTN